MMTNIFTIFVRTKASAQRILEVFASGEDFGGEGGAAEDVLGSVEFDRVTFAYPGGSGLPALTDVSFRLEAGRSLAVIGPTGSGKSTLAWLMLRFYDVSAGRVLLGGGTCGRCPWKTLRGAVALAPQKALLFLRHRGGEPALGRSARVRRRAAGGARHGPGGLHPGVSRKGSTGR
jgi:ATP-binding cassette subfamily B protein